jgi:thiosulfate/3-mercaptopyruvate sulfurtransferase
MTFTTLIDTETLSQHLGDRTFVIVDCRFKLDDVAWGERAHAEAHVPGAVYANLDKDLSGQKTGTNGRHPLPDPSVLGRTFERLGIGDGMQVIAYDQDTGSWASRLWWLLRWMGHDAVAVLDGGFAKWVSEGRSTETGAPWVRATGTFTGKPRPDVNVDVDRVTQLVHNPEWRLIDARPPERYRGEMEPIDRVPGHIPTATNHFFKWNLDEAGTFLPPEALRERLLEAMAGVRPDRVVAYCGSGVTACHDLLAFEHAGLHGAKLYPGSWSEWSSDPARGVERSAGGSPDSAGPKDSRDSHDTPGAGH